MIKLLTLCLIFMLVSCQTESQNKSGLPKAIELITPSKKVINTQLAFTFEEQQQGLSGIKEVDFDDDQAMLFFNLEDGERNFWMPDTYFDLDLFYLDKDLKIIDIVRKLPHYIGKNSPELIPRARPVWARHTLEMKHSSPIAKSLNIGDALIWKARITLKETEDLSRNVDK